MDYNPWNIMILVIYLITMHDELQKVLGKAKTNKAIRIDRIPNEILKNANPPLPTIQNISTELLGPGFYAAY